ncbi:hypothetical protein Naga_100169g6 [Nannochloropsis gaditana]|uniref:Ubiquitin-like domain-containing protein n=1 Tax=Nannochloropsis gaditana TaxID=72520 RepID=W7TN85_9STRA|nr:hypothetical protein Naga_100169g6 [Nannochloropsis gaditana]
MPLYDHASLIGEEDKAWGETPGGGSPLTNNLIVRGPGGQCYPLNVQGDMRVQDLKAQVATAIGVAVEEQYLLHRCKILQDHEALASYDLGTQHHLSKKAMATYQMPTVEVGIRQRGGCFIVTFTLLTILFFATLCAPLTCGTSLCLYLFLLPPVFILPFFCL